MKNLFVSLLILVTLSFSLNAQNALKAMGDDTTTNTVAAATATLSPVNPIIDATHGGDVIIGITHSLVGLGCLSNQVFGFQRSIDKVNWDTNLLLITCPSMTNSTPTNLTRATTLAYVTNAYPYYRLWYENNQASNICTNILIRSFPRK